MDLPGSTKQEAVQRGPILIAGRILGVASDDENLISKHGKPNRRLRPRTISHEHATRGVRAQRVIYGVPSEFHIEVNCCLRVPTKI